MREIKFRAWARCGEWNDDGEKQAFKMIPADSVSFEEFEPLCDLLKDVKDESYLMQYTGLKDKNVVEIYEGDICDVEGHVALLEVKIPGIYLSWELIESQKWSVEVIGNMYENPELLKEKNGVS